VHLLVPITAATTLGFLVIHYAVARGVRRSFKRNLKLSRGIAAAVLVATGTVCAVRWWPLWDRAFLVAHPDPLEAWPVTVFAGHLAADLLWILAGRVFVDSRVARDLVIHHLVGIAACTAAVVLQAGYAVLGVVLLAEILPVLTGLGALARTWRLENVEHWVLRTSLGMILGFRIPLWIFLGVTFTTTVFGPSAPAIHATAAPIAFPALALVIALDLYWVRSYVRLLRDFPRRGVPDLSLDPLAPWFVEDA
jgi:hypothetical protein